jgi:hypothetical protein
MKNRHFLKRRDYLLGLAIFIASMLLYIRTLAPGLLYGDSAEFQTLAYTFGITHPNGYPVFILLARLFTALLPIGGLAWRVNLFSAVCGSLTAVFVYFIVRILSGSRVGAVAGSLVLIINPIFWWNSILIELYVPSAMVVTLVIFLVLRWRQTEKPAYLAVAGLLGGLGFGIHGTISLLAPAVLIYLAFTARTNKKALLAACVGALVGLLLVPTLFIFIDSFNSPSTYYNATIRHAFSEWSLTPAKFDSPIERFIFIFFARQFGSRLFGFDNISSDLGHYLYSLLLYFGPISLIVMIIGSIQILIHSWREGILLVIAFLSQLIFTSTIGVSEIVVFYVPGYAILAIFVGLGVSFIFELTQRFLMRVMSQRVRYVPFLTVLISSVLIIGMIYPYFKNILLSVDKGRITFLDGTPYAKFPFPVGNPDLPHQQAASLVNNLEDNAVVFTGWEMLYAYYFVAHVEQGRTNMFFHELYPKARMDGIAKSTVEYIKRDFDKRKFYFENVPGEDITSLFYVKKVNRGKPIYLITGIK